MYYVRLTVLVLQLSVLGSGEGIDYCDENMCPYQGKHVACGHKKVNEYLIVSIVNIYFLDFRHLVRGVKVIRN